MSDPTARPGTPEHEDYEALAAGYALHALEPEDEQQLSAHLMNCPACARLVADTAALGAAFADLFEPEVPPPGLRERVLAAAAAHPRDLVPESTRRPPIDLDAPRAVAPPRSGRRFRFRPEVRARLAVGALAAAIGVAVAVPVTLAASHHSTPGSTALAQALLQPHAREVTMTAASGGGRATVVLSDKGAFLLAQGLQSNDRARNVYVLWAADAAGVRKAVASFDVRSGSAHLASSTLPYNVSQIHQIAISLESGRTAPAKPTDVLMTGTAA